MSTQPAPPNLDSSEPLPSADVLAKPRKREMLWVSFGQWDRLQGRVTRLGNPRVDYTNYVAGAWGVCIPSLGTFIGYALQHDRPAWALPLWGSIAAAAAIVAKLLDKFRQNEGAIRNEDASDIVAEMKSIEEAFLRSGGSAGVEQ
jgi:hypothetical protein